MYYEDCTLEEILAYRELENEIFNFGKGDMKIEGWYGSEDAYYEMRIPGESFYGDYDCDERLYMDYYTDRYEYIDHKPKPKKKTRLRKYYKKRIDQRRMKELKDLIWWAVREQISEDGLVYYRRDYLSSRKRSIKREANRRVRKTKNIGNYGGYKKVYDYWWEIF